MAWILTFLLLVHFLNLEVNIDFGKTHTLFVIVSRGISLQRPLVLSALSISLYV